MRRGMTLIELMIAILILNVALLALAGLGATVSRQLRQGVTQTRAALQVQSTLDSLASVRPCTDIVTTSQTKTETLTRDGVTQKLVIKDGDDVIHVVDSVSVPGRTKVLVYQSMIPCRDI
jgi:prepilin-type N-terminal cleavage/methylation domain-containing protein